MNKEIKKTELPFKEPEFAFKWDEWLDERKAKKIKAYTEKGVVKTLNYLYAISGGKCDVAIAIIEQSFNLGYQGLFPLKNIFIQKQANGTQYKGSAGQKPVAEIVPEGCFGKL